MSTSVPFDIATAPLPTGRIANLATNAEVTVLGFGISFYLGDLEENNRRAAKLLARIKKKRGS